MKVRRKIRKEIQKERRNEGGRPSSFRKEYIHMAHEACSTMGATISKLANMFQVNQQTIHNWMRYDDRFFDAVNKGRLHWDTEAVQRSTVQRAMGYTVTETETTKKFIRLKKKDEKGRFIYDKLPGQIVKTKERHVPADPTLAMFWLQNRLGHLWKNVRNVRINGAIDHKVIAEQEKKLDRLSLEERRQILDIMRKVEQLPVPINIEAEKTETIH